jgi:hypothetical protein
MLSTQAGSSGVSMENNKTVNLIWFGESANLWGKSWIEELLKDVDLVYRRPRRISAIYKKKAGLRAANCYIAAA